ncbi:MAG: cytochrome B6, partial [Gammaproteobacteria bacterium]
MNQKRFNRANAPLVIVAMTFGVLGADKTSLAGEQATSYAPVDIKKAFSATLERMKEAKAKVMQRQEDLLQERYDLSDRPAKGAAMTGGKPIQEGVRVKLPEGVTWVKLAGMSPAEIQSKGAWPAG